MDVYTFQENIQALNLRIQPDPNSEIITVLSKKDILCPTGEEKIYTSQDKKRVPWIKVKILKRFFIKGWVNKCKLENGNCENNIK